MGALDLLHQWFSQAPQAPAGGQAPPSGNFFNPAPNPPPMPSQDGVIDPSLSPIMQFLKQSGLGPPAIDPAQTEHRARQRALLGASAGLIANPNDNFITSLARGVGGGATGYLDSQDKTMERKRSQNEELMKSIFGLAGQEAMGQYRMAGVDARNYATDSRLQGLEAQLAEATRHNGQTEAGAATIAELRQQIADTTREMEKAKSEVATKKAGTLTDTGTGLSADEYGRRTTAKETRLQKMKDDGMATPEQIAAEDIRLTKLYRLEGGEADPTQANPIPDQAATAAPPPIASRVVGQVYTNAKGQRAIWTGKGWQSAQ